MRLFGILLLLVIIPVGGAYVYFATQDWKGRQQINAAGLRHLLLLQGLPVEGEDFSAEDETPFEVPMAGGESTKTVGKKLLENYFKDNTAAGTGFASTDPVTNQAAEVERVRGLLKAELDKAATPEQKIALLVSFKDPVPPPAGGVAVVGSSGGWLLLQAETMTERARYLALASPTVLSADKVEVAKESAAVAADADELAHALDLKFYRVAPKLYEQGKPALAQGKWDALQAKIAEAGGDAAAVARLKPPVATDDADRRTRLAHLLVHLDRDAGWQRRVAVVVGLRRYVQVIASQIPRFREMRDHADLPNAADQAAYQKNQDALIVEARQKVDRARATAAEKKKMDEQRQAARDVLATRVGQLVELEAQLKKVRDEVDQLLVQQGAQEKKLFEAQRLVSLTLEDVYRLEALLIEVERERYGLSPARP